MSSKITFKNILSFLEGNFKFYFYKYTKAPTYLKEQYAYRLEKCEKDCVKQKKCVYCGCPPIKKAFTKESCNKGKRFPDLMSENQWIRYKQKNNIT